MASGDAWAPSWVRNCLKRELRLSSPPGLMPLHGGRSCVGANPDDIIDTAYGETAQNSTGRKSMGAREPGGGRAQREGEREGQG